MSSSSDELLAIAVQTYLKRKKKKPRRFGVHPINSVRLNFGQFHTLFSQLKEDRVKFFSYYRMKMETFYELLSYVKEDIEKEDTKFRCAITAEERLSLTLR